MAKYKTIIFDFDGVIADSVNIKTRAFAYLFRDYSKEIISEVVKYHLENGGKSRYVKFKHYYENILKIEYNDAIGETLAGEFSRFVFNEVVSCPFIEGAKEFIENNYKKYCFFIVSGTPDEEIKRIVVEKGLSPYFKEVFGTPEKKDFWVRHILYKNKLLASETVFIGDALDDYKGAAANGCGFIGVVKRDAYNPFLEVNPELIVENLLKLDEILDSM